MKQYFPVFDRLKREFLAGEMIWTFTDYNVLEGIYHEQNCYIAGTFFPKHVRSHWLPYYMTFSRQS